MGLFEKIKYNSPTQMYAFFVGFFCALLGIVTAFFLIKEFVGLVSVFFTSLALLPFWSRMLSAKTVMEGTEEEITKGKGIIITEIKVVSLREKINPIKLIKSYSNVFNAYVFSFLGIFLVYALLQVIAPTHLLFGDLFKEQVQIASIGPGFSVPSFEAIFANNFFVILVCFLISLIYRSGVIIIAWNAGVWGYVFGAIAHNAATVYGKNIVLYFFGLIASVAPHIIAEAAAYLAASIAGVLLFEAIWLNLKNKNFYFLVADAVVLLVFSLLLLVAGALLEVIASPALLSMLL